MGRTHKLLPTTQSNYIPHLKGIHPKAGWRGPSTNASVQVEMDSENEETFDYQKIVSVFYNYYFDKEFTSSIRNELLSYYDPENDDEYDYDKNKGSDTHIQNIISMIIDYMENVIEKNKNKKWVVNGLCFNETIDLTNFDIYEFENALEHYFEDFTDEKHYMWLEHYSPTYSDEMVDEMEEDENELNYETLVAVFYNYYFDKEFTSSIRNELLSYYDPENDDEHDYDKNKGSDTHIQNIISMIIDYMKNVIEKNKNKKWVVNGGLFYRTIDLTNFDIYEFKNALEHYFKDFTDEAHYMWLKHYSPTYLDEIIFRLNEIV
jgi:hypothetical protein